MASTSTVSINGGPAQPWTALNPVYSLGGTCGDRRVYVRMNNIIIPPGGTAEIDAYYISCCPATCNTLQSVSDFHYLTVYGRNPCTNVTVELGRSHRVMGDGYKTAAAPSSSGPVFMSDGETSTFCMEYPQYQLIGPGQTAAGTVNFSIGLPKGMMFASAVDLVLGSSAMPFTASPSSTIMNATMDTLMLTYPSGQFRQALISRTFSVCFSASLDCSKPGVVGGTQNISYDWNNIPNPACTPVACVIPMRCNDRYQLNLNCPDPCPDGGGTIRSLTAARTNVGQADPTNTRRYIAGAAPANPADVRTDRLSPGDTLCIATAMGISIGAQSDPGPPPFWRTGVLEHNMDWGQSFTPMPASGAIRLGGVLYNFTGLVPTVINSGTERATFRYDITPATLSALNPAIPSGALLLASDSIFVNACYRFRTNDLRWLSQNTDFSAASGHLGGTRPNFIGSVLRLSIDNGATYWSCGAVTSRVHLVSIGTLRTQSGSTADPINAYLATCGELNPFTWYFFNYRGLLLAERDYDFYPNEFRPIMKLDTFYLPKKTGFVLKSVLHRTYTVVNQQHTILQDVSISAPNITEVGNEYRIILRNMYEDNGGPIRYYEDNAWYGIFPYYGFTCELKTVAEDPSLRDHRGRYHYHNPKALDVQVSGAMTLSRIIRPLGNFSYIQAPFSVDATKVENDFRLIVTNQDAAALPFTWLSFAPNPNVEVTNVSVGGVNMVYDPSGHWRLGSHGSLASKTITITAKLLNCNASELEAIMGWNCGGYPNTVDATGCSFDTIPYLIQPINAQITLVITDQPTAELDLCEPFTLGIDYASVFQADVLNPKVEIVALPGLSINGITGTYPGNSGNTEPMSYTVLPNGNWLVDLTSHSMVTGDSLPGVITNPLPNPRLFQLDVTFSSSCDFNPGQRMRFIGQGESPCGLGAINSGSTTFGAPVRIVGANPYQMGFNVVVDQNEFPINGCGGGSATLDVTALVLGGTTTNADTIVVDLPAGVMYRAGSFVCTSASCPTVSSYQVAPNGSSKLKLKLSNGIPNFEQMDFSFIIETGLIEACSDSLPYTIRNTLTIDNVLCMGTACPDPIVSILGEYLGGFAVDKVLPVFANSTACKDVSNTYRIKTNVQMTGFGIAATDSLVLNFYCASNPSVVIGSYTIYGPVAVGAVVMIDHTIAATCINETSLIYRFAEANNCLCETVQMTVPITLVATNVAQLSECSIAPGASQATFTLTEANIQVDPTGMDVVTYHDSYTEAVAGTNALTSPYTSPTITIWSRRQNAQGCAAVDIVQLEVNSLPVAILQKTNITCSGLSDGSITAVPTSGQPNYTYLWSNAGASTTATISGLGIGTYTVTVTDGNSCTTTVSSTITAPTALSLTMSSSPILCAGTNDGTATVSPSGGVAPYTYFWNNGNSSSLANGLAIGTYTVTVTDNNGCTQIGMASVGGPAMVLTANTVINANPTCGAATGQATASGANGLPPYTYLWSNGQTTATATGLSSGLYIVIVTDANMCTAQGTALLAASGAPSASVTKTNIDCNGNANGSATVTVVGGSPTFLWSTGQTTATINNLDAGLYQVSITSGACQSVLSVEIFEPTLLVANVIQQTNPICMGGTGSATIYATGGITPYTIAWSNGQTGLTATGLAAGNHTVTVTDANDCDAVLTINIVAGPTLQLIAIANDSVCPNSSIGAILLQSTPSNPATVYTWTGGAAAGMPNGTSTGINPNIPAFVASTTQGTYTINVTATLGACVSMTTFEIEILDNIAPAFTNCPKDMVMPATLGNCGIVISWDVPVAIDNCSGGVLTSTQTFGLPPGSTFTSTGSPYSIAYEVTDGNGNTSTCRFTIIVEDDQAPAISCPANLVMSMASDLCVFNFAPSIPSVTDNCGAVAALTIRYRVFGPDNSISGPFNQGMTFNFIKGISLIEFSVTDAAGNVSTCIQQITVNDTQLPIITCPTVRGLPGFVVVAGIRLVLCGARWCWSNRSFPVAAAGWGAARVPAIVGTCGCPSVFLVVYLVFLDAAAASYSKFSPGVCKCDELNAAITTWRGTATATDNCTASPTITGPKSTNSQCGNTETRLYRFTATDAAGNSSVCEAMVFIVDTTPPTISTPAANQTVQCDGNGNVAQLLAWLNNRGGAVATDLCGSVSWSNNYTGITPACGNTGSTTVIFTVSDACGNTTTSQAMFIIQDTTNPTITAPANITLSCGFASNDAIVQAWLQSYVASDACSNVTVTNNFTSIPATCVAGSNTATVTWTATDACGRTATGTATITVVDNIKPVIMTSPLDLVVECTAANRAAAIAAWLASFGGAAAVDNCDLNLTQTFTAGTPVAGCGMTSTTVYTYTATDDCGNFVQRFATLFIIDNTAPVLTLPTATNTVACDGAITTVRNAWFASASGLDGCGGTVTISQSLVSQDESCVGTVNTITETYLFTATDACGNQSTNTAVFTIRDAVAPTIIAPANLTIACGGNNATAILAWLQAYTVTEACSDYTVTNNYNGSIPNLCNGGPTTVMWTVTDECGATGSATSQIVVTPDTQGPTFVNCPADITVNVDIDLCASNVIYSTPVATDCNGVASVTRTSGIVSGGVFPLGATSIVFTATDNCGNTSTCNFTITVVDSDKPNISCPSNTVVVCTDNNVCTWVSDASVNPLGVDNCPGATISYVITGMTPGSGTNSAMGTVFNLGTSIVTYTITAANGQTATCSFNVVVEDCQVPVITCPANLTVECASATLNAAITTWRGTATATDNCTASPTITSADHQYACSKPNRPV
ncbi:MAG: HYR domain-containing protein [Saprospiraceae bacterium]|nr:HYR domain-containing protein [Saprospiraceae bacterium]